MSPLYPRLIRWAGSGWSAAGDQVLPAAGGRGLRLLQIVCWLGVVLLLHLTARRVLNPVLREIPVAGPVRDLLPWIPSLLFVLYRPVAIFTLTILLEIPLLFLVALFLYLLTLEGKARWQMLGLALVLGLVLGTAMLLRGTVAALLPLAVWRIWILTRSPGRTASRAGGLPAQLVLVLALSLPLLPAVLAGSRDAGRLAGPTLNGGINLYIGNSAAANGFYVEPVGRDKRSDPAGTRHLARRLGREDLTVAQADAAWARAAWQAMAERPGHALQLYLKKIWLHLQAWEIDQLVPQAGWAGGVPLLRALFVPYGWLVVLGLGGLAAAWQTQPWARRWALGLGLLVLVQSLFFVVTRYRLVLVPFLCLAVAVGCAAFLRERPLRRPSRWLPVAATLLMTTLLIQPWGLDAVRTRWASLGQVNEARRWAQLGQEEADPAALEEARRLYAAAAPALAGEAEAWLGWATTCRALGRDQEAEEVLNRALLRVSRDRQLRHLLVGILLEQERLPEALMQVQALLKEHPRDAAGLHNATVLLARLGHPDEALATARRYRAFHPTDPQAALDLGVLLARAGQVAEARRVFQEGLAASPGHAGLEHNLAALGPAP